MEVQDDEEDILVHFPHDLSTHHVHPDAHGQPQEASHDQVIEQDQAQHVDQEESKDITSRAHDVGSPINQCHDDDDDDGPIQRRS